MRNTHKLLQVLSYLDEILEIADKTNKKVVAYLSMGGNPYDPWDVEIVGDWTEKLSKMGVKILSLSDTVGNSTPDVISYLFSNLIPQYPEIEFGAHLHTTDKWFEKIGCLSCGLPGWAIQGFGGCPMAKDDLTGICQRKVVILLPIKENT
jgi:hydroxymethylglutaryl-CoA lyase